MVSGYRAEMTVDSVHRLPSRHLQILVGRLAGETVRVGDEVVVRTPEGRELTAAVRTIELHLPPGLTGLGLDVRVGDVPAGSTVLLP
ncbi:hypothetical protein [Micromonospora sp. HM5-17]|uniref:hypothetical protein n=1 Tax=Micromonospora sp. HM5-17 TaxID=2487710 RepID=UPI0011CD6187|nr:hypothetical protein [Micromonospora sp. HM5-17]